MTYHVRQFFAALFALTLVACDRIPEPFILTAGADLEAVVQIDLIAVSDTEVAAMLHAAGADGWFENRQRLLRQYDGAVAMKHYQVPPGYLNEMAVWPELAGADAYMIAIRRRHGSDFMAIDARTVKTITVGKNGIQVKT